MNNLLFENVQIDTYKDTIDELVKTIFPEDLTYKSTKGEKSKQYNLINFYNVDEKFTSLVNKIKESVLLCLQKNNLHHIKNLSVVSCWTVYGEENGYHTIHRHNGYNVQHFSTVTYLKTPVTQNKNSGNFFYFANDDVHEIIPIDGVMIIMPIWMLHGTYPQSKGLRQTLSVDFSFETTLN